MIILLTSIFILTYVAIAFEHPIKVNKSASALVGAGFLWTIYALLSTEHSLISDQLNESVATTAQIVFFLMGAMTIVEVIDAHGGFEVVTAQIKSNRLSGLLWLIAIVTFVLSALLDNLTTTIVMVSLIRKLLHKAEDRLLFAAMIVIAANAGGAWSPIGDVTTTMLWIGGQISALGIIKALILPSIVNMVIPVSIVSYRLRGRTFTSSEGALEKAGLTLSTIRERNIIFYVGIGLLILVPIFKTVTHLPPFMGILFSLGLLWLIGDVLHREKLEDDKKHLSLTYALMRIDMSSIIFFIGILLAVATLEHSHILNGMATWLDYKIGRQDLIVTLMGILSAVVDNVPLVAASMGMYDIAKFPTDSFLWEFIAYCAGTGGSILIIGSAAGVAAMGLEKIEFGWYFRKISWLALLGYFGGVVTYIIQYQLIH
jgi:NhaD family Na+/H+ antiporter